MLKAFKVSLFTKFIITMVALAAIPVIITGWQLIDINKKGLEGTILELHTHHATKLSDQIKTYMSTIEKQMTFIINATEEAKGLSSTILRSLIDSDDNFLILSFIDKQGKELLKVYNEDIIQGLELGSIADHPTFKQIKKMNIPQKGLLSPVYFRIPGNIPCIDAFYQMNKSNIIFATLSLSALWNDINNTKIGKTGHAFMVDSHANLIAHRDLSRVLAKDNVKELAIVRNALKADSVGSSEYTLPNGKTMVGAYAPVPALGWGVIIEQEKAEAFVTEILSRKEAIKIGSIVILIAIFIAFFMARGLSRPILKLIDGAERVSGGDFTTQVHIHTSDELRDLAQTFNSMIRKLKTYSDIQVDKIIAEKTKTEAIIFSIADGIIMTDYEGKIQLINNQALKIFDIPPADINTKYEGKKIYDLIPQEAILPALKDIITNPDKSDIREIDLSVGTTARFYKINAGKVKALKGDNLGIVTVVHDITLEKQLDNLKEEFLHSITHDLRNPMTSIRGFLRFLLDGIAGEVNPQQKKMLGTMDRASEKLLTMINDILDIAKLEAGKLDVSIEDINIRDIAAHVIEIAKGLSQRKNITFNVVIDESIGTIQADPKLIERALTNLLGNAVKFTPEEGKITLKINDVDNTIKVSVIDNGEGIPPDYIDKVFDKFKQVMGQRKGGTGLGLTICKYIVEGHKGQIWAESKLNQGSTFIFTIPKNLVKSDMGKIQCA